LSRRRRVTDHADRRP